MAGSCGHDNELSVSINGEEFVDQPGDFGFSRRALLHGVGSLVG